MFVCQHVRAFKQKTRQQLLSPSTVRDFQMVCNPQRWFILKQKTKNKDQLSCVFHKQNQNCFLLFVFWFVWGFLERGVYDLRTKLNCVKRYLNGKTLSSVWVNNFYCFPFSFSVTMQTIPSSCVVVGNQLHCILYVVLSASCWKIIFCRQGWKWSHTQRVQYHQHQQCEAIYQNPSCGCNEFNELPQFC